MIVVRDNVVHGNSQGCLMGGASDACMIAGLTSFQGTGVKHGDPLTF
jgi:hypothetical protein